MSSSLIPIKDSYEILCHISAKAYEGLSLVFPVLPAWVTERKAENLVQTCKRVQEKLDKAGIAKEQLRHCSLKLGLPWVENASLEEEPSLQELWANLLANSLNPNFKQENLRIAFISIIKDLTPLDASIVKHIHENLIEFFRKVNRGEELGSMTNGVPVEQLISTFNVDRELIDISIDNLTRLGIVSTTTRKYEYDNAFVELVYVRPHLTTLGCVFAQACTRVKISR